MMRNVPCGRCTACCQGDVILMHPEMGDQASDYETEEIPINGQLADVLKQKDNGDCIYLGAQGCTIHERAPAICREFDCRDLWRRLGSRAERRRMVAAGMVSKDVLDAGRERSHKKSGKE